MFLYIKRDSGTKFTSLTIAPPPPPRSSLLLSVLYTDATSPQKDKRGLCTQATGGHFHIKVTGMLGQY